MSQQTNPSLTSVLDNAYKKDFFNQGENGMNQVSYLGLLDCKEVVERVQSSLVGLNVALVRGNNSKRGNLDVDRNRIIKLIQSCVECVEELSNENKILYLKHLFVLIFSKRDIRGCYGSGERTLSFWSFIELTFHYPEIMLNLFEILPDVGSWLDFKYIYGICCEDLKLEVSHKKIDLLTKIKEKIIAIIHSQLMLDEYTLLHGTDKKQLSLLAKWIPKQNSEYSKKYKMDKVIAKKYFPSLWKKDFKKACKALRHLVSTLNTQIATTEKLMCEKRFSEINFEIVPGRCLNKNHKAWLDINKNGVRKNIDDQDRETARLNYLKFLDRLYLGKSSSKGNSMFIHEIVNEVLVHLQIYKNTEKFRLCNQERYDLLNAQFNDHFIKINSCSHDNLLSDTVFQVDVSGSMVGDPLGVSIGVGILGASLENNKYKNRLITFENIPRWIILEYPCDKINYTYSYPGYRNNTYPLGEFKIEKVCKELDWIEKIAITGLSGWGGNTNFLAATEMVASVAQLNNIQMPKNIICITDMQWDDADGKYYPSDVYTNSIAGKIDHNKSFLNNIDMLEYYFKNTFTKGTNFPIGMPKYIVWNVRGNQDKLGFPVKVHDTRVQMISGFSTSMLKIFLKKGVFNEDKNSWDILEEILEHHDYDNVRNIINHTISQDNKLEVRGHKIKQNVLYPASYRPSQDWDSTEQLKHNYEMKIKSLNNSLFNDNNKINLHQYTEQKVSDYFEKLDKMKENQKNIQKKEDEICDNLRKQANNYTLSNTMINQNLNFNNTTSDYKSARYFW